MKKRIFGKLALLAFGLMLGRSILAQTTAFTYQGRLMDTGAPANGSYDFEFAVYDAVTNGDLISGIVTETAVTVSNGIFTTTLDFGPDIFTGSDLWLDIEVSTNAANAFVEITPRQMITPAPYALYAQTAGTAANVPASSVSVPQLNTPATPSPGQVLAFDGTELVWQNPVVGGSTGGWALTGNLGTTAGVDFLGTLDPQPMEIHVGGGRAFRLEPDTSGNASPNVLGGSSANFVAPGTIGAAIGGGGGLNSSNSVTASYGTIAGGVRNIAGGQESTVAGGFQNTASGYISTVAGGAYNTANTNESAVLGGAFNVASGVGASVAGGGYDGQIAAGNTASGQVSFVGSGLDNVTSGYASAIGGGLYNSASGSQGYVGGGANNVASGSDDFVVPVGIGFDFIAGNSAVVGGYGNAANATCAAIPGGCFNTASGDCSFAGGFQASAAHTGSFVWSDTSSSGSFSTSLANQFIIRATNGVGIGSSLTPPGGLRVASGGLAVTGASSPNYQGATGVFIEKGNNIALMYGYNYSASGPLPLCLNSPGGNVGIGTTAPGVELDVNGVTRTHSIIITGGSDVAEPFKMGTQSIAKGSVVVIDEQHPGELKLSDQPYDKRVAGIVSGANGIKPGIALYQEGALEGGQNVALSGRVYVLADATKSAIHVGDLLTSSDTPGHAMRVKNHSRAQGAIIGKAMTGLSQGRGMVLVLVTLQ